VNNIHTEVGVNYILNLLGFQVVIAASMKKKAFWDIAPHSPLSFLGDGGSTHL
jgi:hypothetical protein